MQPVTRYAKSGDVHVAYQVFGEGKDGMGVTEIAKAVLLRRVFV